MNYSAWNPVIEEESSNGVREISLLARHLTNRRLFLSGEVTEEMANNFVSSLLYLAESSEPVDIYINSPGGQINAGLIIYDVIQSLDGVLPINIYCTGIAASMAAWILAGGQKGRRFILPHSLCMIHEPLALEGVGGSASSIKQKAESILALREMMNGILAKHTGKTVEEINEATAFDNVMNAEEAVKFGLCDEIRNIF